LDSDALTEKNGGNVTMTDDPTHEEPGRRDMLLQSAAIAVAAALTASAAQPASAQTQGAATAQAQPTVGARNPKPNVVFILSDNVGFGDLGSYGGGELRGAPTPRIDQLAREGLRLTQFLVEPACTPSRAALMTGQYSIRNGLSLVVIPGGENTLSADAFTMGDMFHGLGYATAIFGKWHLGQDPQSLPTAHGFDEYYGIPPGWSWDSCIYVDAMMVVQTMGAPRDVLIARGPQIVEGRLGEPLHNVKAFTQEVRAEIDNELTDKSIDFIKRQRAAGKPFFLYLPFSMGHYPSLPSKEFAGKSRIGNYGDKLMEGDYHVGRILDTLKDLGIDNDTIVIFASDNGPSATGARELGNLGTPDFGNMGPFRGELGDVTEGSIRTVALVRWPGQVPANTSSYAMFSIMDFLPTLAGIVGGKMPTDRPIDGVDQSELLFGRSAVGHREHLLSFIGAELAAARWKQFRAYFTDMRPTGEGTQRVGGLGSSDSPMAGYPKLFNIEADPHEDLNVVNLFPWVADPILGAIEEYERSVREHPNPPAPNMTRFRAAG
jgi:arylsulfatase